ncbi:MAG: aminotransferase class IV [bacterium]|nr:aminotransferase class IV [bacterium]MDD3625575.1 aminotransferase class IV [Proteiniphilum sp.]
MFLESICIINGQPQNMEAHLTRMRLTAAQHGFTAPDLPDPLLLLPDHLNSGKVKWRIEYDEKIVSVEFLPYQPKVIHSLRLVRGNPDYAFKYADRGALEKLLKLKSSCDEILIVRNGLITDTSFSNVLLQQGDRFFTPATFLLNGTRRQQLLREGIITEKEIPAAELQNYDYILLINAMLDINNAPRIPISNICG